MTIDADDVKTAVHDYAHALQAEEPAAKATADAVRKARNLLAHTAPLLLTGPRPSGPASGLLREVCDRPDRYGPQSTRDLLLTLSADVQKGEVDEHIRGRCTFQLHRTAVFYVLLTSLDAISYLESGSLGTPQARKVRASADTSAVEAALRRWTELDQTHASRTRKVPRLHWKTSTWTARIDHLAKLVALSWRPDAGELTDEVTGLKALRPVRYSLHREACPVDVRAVDESCSLRTDSDYRLIMILMGSTCALNDDELSPARRSDTASDDLGRYSSGGENTCSTGSVRWPQCCRAFGIESGPVDP